MKTYSTHPGPIVLNDTSLILMYQGSLALQDQTVTLCPALDPKSLDIGKYWYYDYLKNSKDI